VFAIVSFVLAAVLIALGVAQRTVFASPDEFRLDVAVTSDAPVTVIEGTTLNALDGRQTLEISGADGVFAAYGRTDDVLGWVGESEHTLVRYAEEESSLVAEEVAGSETEVPSPQGSDLWLDSFSDDARLDMTVDLPEDVSVLLVSDGTAPAPSDISLMWPLDDRTPFSGPLILAGAVVLLLGLILLVWALLHMRASRGPRRKSRRLPKLPRQPRLTSRRTTRPIAGRRSGRRGMVAVPIVMVGTLALSGCTAESWPDFSPQPTPTPSAAAPGAAIGIDAPAATVRQVERIVADVSEVSAAADEARDPAMLESRFSGPAFERRAADYQIRTADEGIGSSVPVIPDGPVEVVLPQQTQTWPRTVFSVIQDDQDATIPTVALMLIQDSPRENYKVHYAVTLEASAQLPDLAPASLGAARLGPDTPLLSSAPSGLAAAYADVLARDAESPENDRFRAEGDTLREAVGVAAKQAQAEELPDTASIEFTNSVGEEAPIAMATNDAGALVTVAMSETTTVRAAEEAATVDTSGSVQALAGTGSSTVGFEAVYGYQLLFYVPPAGGDDQVVLLGYHQGLDAAREIQ
jgi:hypothetical protein